MAKAMKIGVFDSGIGGITVLSELKHTLGFVDYVYLGDTANVPYGAKSPAQIERLSVSCAHTLKQKNIDALVIACNTASSLALDSIEREMYPVPVFGVVQPGANAALRTLGTMEIKKERTPILILATRATVQSHAYGNALQKQLISPLWAGPSAVVLEQSCPLLVPMIEEGWVEHSVLHQTIEEYVRPHRENHPTGVALLGCTHYPWIFSAFVKALPGWKVVNPAHSVAQSVKTCHLLAEKTASKNDGAPGQIEWIFTDPDAVPAFAKLLIEGGSWN